jgi:hypothetical protein
MFSKYHGLLHNEVFIFEKMAPHEHLTHTIIRLTAHVAYCIKKKTEYGTSCPPLVCTFVSPQKPTEGFSLNLSSITRHWNLSYPYYFLIPYHQYTNKTAARTSEVGPTLNIGL